MLIIPWWSNACSALKHIGSKACITLVEEHILSEVIPSDHLLPIDYNLVRIIAAENALLVESDVSEFD